MFKKSRLCAMVLGLVSLGSGCANSLQFNFRPEPVKLASSAEAGGDALVLGQAYLRQPGDWVQLFITAVDDTSTWSPTKLRPDLHLLVPAGKRTFTVKVQIGNFLRSGEATGPQQVSADLKAGMVYQLNAREGTDVRGRNGVDLWVEQIGTIAQYERFAGEHPGAAGRPVEHL